VNCLKIDSTRLARDVVCLDVIGDVDMASSEALNRAIRNALTAAGVKRVMVDLSKVPFLDARGIHTLVENHSRARDQDITLQVVNPSRVTVEVLTITDDLRLLTGEA